jgi:hypothetical protein
MQHVLTAEEKDRLRGLLRENTKALLGISKAHAEDVSCLPYDMIHGAIEQALQAGVRLGMDIGVAHARRELAGMKRAARAVAGRGGKHR